MILSHLDIRWYMKKKIDAPIIILIAVAKRGQGEQVCKILSRYEEKHHMVFNASGSTASSDIADIFGFGIRESDVVVSIIPPEDSEELIEEISSKLEMHIADNGIVFTVPIESASSSMLKMLDLKGGDLR